MKVWFGLVSAIAAVLAGIYACCWTRFWDPKTKATGWPFPIAIFQLEDGHWVDFIGRGWQLPANFLVGFALAMLPFLAYCFLARPPKPPQS